MKMKDPMTSTTRMQMTSTKIPSSDIYTYEKQALDSLPIDHPNYEEIKDLLIKQINDDLRTHANTCTD